MPDSPFSRRSLIAGGGAVAVALLAGCTRTNVTPGNPAGGGGADLMSKAKQQGFLTCVVGNEPPYTKVETDGTVTGCEPDVLRAVCKKLGINEVKGIVSPYESMIPGLQANRWDVIAAGLFMKQSRCSQVAYSEPVIVSTESFLVPAGNPKKITTVASVLADPSLKIGVIPGGFEEGILKSAKVPDNQRVSTADGRSGYEALKAKRVDAFLLPSLSLKSLVTNDPSVEITPQVPDAPKTGSGAGFRPADKAFVDQYNQALAEFKKTPDFDAILNKWGFDPEAARGATAAELCKNEG